MKKLLYAIKKTFSLLLCSSKLLFIPYIFLKILDSIIPLTSIYIFNLLITEISLDLNINVLLHYSLIYTIMLFADLLIKELIYYIYYILYDKFIIYYDIDISKKINQIGLDVLDTNEGNDMLDNVYYSKYSSFNFFISLVHILSLVVSILITSINLFLFNYIYALIFALTSIPGVIFTHLSQNKYERYRKEKSPDVRKFSYYRWMLTDPWPSKDIRMYNLTNDIKDKYSMEYVKYTRDKKIIDNYKLKTSFISAFMLFLSFAFFTFFVIRSYIDKVITLGQISLYIGYAGAFVTKFTNFTNLILTTLLTYPKIIGENKEFEGKIEKNENKIILKEFYSMEFKNVSFKYPTSNDYILENINFKINKGDKIMIVGENGIGKTTLIKLMLGLYKVNAGSILINDENIERYDRHSMSALFSILFQNFIKFPLSIRENVGLSNYTSMNDDKKIKNSLKLAKSKLANEEDLDTYLSRELNENGIELSGGEWQRVALARAYFKNSDIIILDEPSAALDALAEDYIFKTFKQMSNNKTGILISHRISSFINFNNILVLKNKKIIEKGTHDELLKIKGEYYQLYLKQSEKFL